MLKVLGFLVVLFTWGYPSGGGFENLTYSWGVPLWGRLKDDDDYDLQTLHEAKLLVHTKLLAPSSNPTRLPSVLGIHKGHPRYKKKPTEPLKQGLGFRV